MKLVFSSLILITCFALSSSVALSCQCKREASKTATEALKNYGGVFSGKVLKIKGPKTRKRGNRVEFLGQFIEVTFRVMTSWKTVESEEVTILTPFSDCSYPFEVGEEYLVWADRVDKEERLVCGFCSRTAKLANSASELADLGEGKKLMR